MSFKNFRLGILFRVLLLTLTISTFLYLWFLADKRLSAFLIGLLGIYEIYQLYYYVENTNRKLTRFLEYVKYSDFASSFAADNDLGKSFKELNDSFNEVLEAFREERSEKEENLQYLNTVVQHVGIGLISFDQNGKVELMNSAASRLLYITNILNISELREMHPELTNIIFELPPGGKALYRSTDRQLSIHGTEIRLRGQTFKLISIQNIQNELQQKELEAWQNLTSVLRHEIMNSITPISSLISTMNEIFQDELPESYQDMEEVVINTEVIDDVKEALETIGRRSHALIRFVNAYKQFTHIPKPKFKLTSVKELLDSIVKLLHQEIRKKQVDLVYHMDEESLKVTMDPEMVEMVLINLLKNASQAVEGREGAKVELSTGIDENQRTFIRVVDNGPGIIPEALDQIFIPFYTTKKDGSGIGLSLSRQIMQLHRGTLSVKSNPNEMTEFRLTF